MRYHSYLNTAKTILASYTGAEPLSAYLKKFFASDKKYGSKDRKQVTALCYNYYRLGKAARDMPVEERILLSTFLCERSSSEFLKFHKPEWNDVITLTTAEKLSLSNYELLIDNIFPWSSELSNTIVPEQFARSFLQQPDLFLRIRPGKKDIVVKKLLDAGLGFQLITEDCIALPNSSKVDTVLKIDEEVVIQDRNSQKVLDFLRSRSCPHPVKGGNDPFISVWDCCAASGGKSILAYDILQGNIELTVSDIRESILSNLKKRFKTAGIDKYNSFITDLSTPDYQLPTTSLPAGQASYQLLIFDAPCTGSGTWSRTPEQAYFFKPEKIIEFAERQKQMVFNLIPYLQKGGLFFYITCSVFREENEAIAAFIKEKFPLRMESMECLRGYENRADSMFVAVFKKE